MVFQSYRLYMVNVQEDVKICSVFYCRDDTEALIKALELISARCQRGIHGEHTLLDYSEKPIEIRSFLDDYGCPQARYDPTRTDLD